MRALIEFIDAHLEAGPDDDEFTLWATRAAGGHLGQLVDDLRVERDQLRELWLEWERGDYDGPDLLRRVRLALHGPLRKPGAGKDLPDGGKR